MLPAKLLPAKPLPAPTSLIELRARFLPLETFEALNPPLAPHAKTDEFAAGTPELAPQSNAAGAQHLQEWGGASTGATASAARGGGQGGHGGRVSTAATLGAIVGSGSAVLFLMRGSRRRAHLRY